MKKNYIQQHGQIEVLGLPFSDAQTQGSLCIIKMSLKFAS